MLPQKSHPDLLLSWLGDFPIHITPWGTGLGRSPPPPPPHTSSPAPHSSRHRAPLQTDSGRGVSMCPEAVVVEPCECAHPLCSNARKARVIRTYVLHAVHPAWQQTSAEQTVALPSKSLFLPNRLLAAAPPPSPKLPKILVEKA